MNTIKEILRINEEELKRGLAGTSGSWHTQYAQSAWVYLGNLDHFLTEGDVICVLSQYGEIEDIHLVRDEETGKSRGFAFAKYEDARSCVLAVDNLCGVQLCGRSLRIDHVENYRLPKHLLEKNDNDAKFSSIPTSSSNLMASGLAYAGRALATEFSLERGLDVFAPRPILQVPPSHEIPVTAHNETNLGSPSTENDEKTKLLTKLARKQERERKRAAKSERHKRREERHRRHADIL